MSGKLKKAKKAKKPKPPSKKLAVKEVANKAYGKAPTHARTIFISDFHFGYKGFDAYTLLDFLRQINCDYLFLNGDIFDGWKLMNKWYWPEAYDHILDEIIALSIKGVKVIFILGNHDEELRRLDRRARIEYAKRLDRIQIKVRNQEIHEAADGKRYLVLHGDQFDSILYAGPISYYADKIYSRINLLLGTDRRAPLEESDFLKAKRTPFSLAKELVKQTSKGALRVVSNYEAAALKRARRSKLDGIICGHTHIPKVREDKHGTIYANSGTWMGNVNSALIEDFNGQLSVLHWKQKQAKKVRKTKLSKAEKRLVRPIRNMIIKELRDIWPGK